MCIFLKWHQSMNVYSSWEHTFTPLCTISIRILGTHFWIFCLTHWTFFSIAAKSGYLCDILQGQHVLNFFIYSSGQEVKISNSFTLYILRPVNLCRTIISFARSISNGGYPFKTRGRLLYLTTQFVPRCKHFSSRL